jgi:hypothetical protein
MVLKKNQALDDRINPERKGYGRSNVQISDDPLHDAKVVQHLDEGDEKDDGTQDSDEKPLLVDDGVFIEEEDRAYVGFLQEVGSEESYPLENLEAGVGLEDEQGNSLLEEKADDNRLPVSRFQVPVRHHSNVRIGVVGTADQEGTHHGICERLWDVNQKENWKTKRPRTEIARSP